MSKKDEKEKEQKDPLLESLIGSGKDDDYLFVYNSDEDADGNFLVPKFFFRTGVTPIDLIIGEGGFASSKISEVYGPPKSGKSELAQSVVSAFLVDNPTGIAVYFDQETAIDDKKLRTDPIFGCGRLIVRKSKTLEGIFKTIKRTVNELVKSGTERPVLYVIDSVAATETEEERGSEEIGSKQWASQARVLSTGLRQIRGKLLDTNAHLLVVNQVRLKPGEMFSTQDSACGEALKFYADYRLKMVNIGGYKLGSSKKGESKPPDGYKIVVQTVKNKRVTPMRKVTVPLLFSRHFGLESGLSDVFGMWENMKAAGVIMKHKSGGWFKLRDEKEEDPFQKAGFIDLYRASIDEQGKVIPESSLGRSIVRLESILFPSTDAVSVSLSEVDDDGESAPSKAKNRLLVDDDDADDDDVEE